MERRKKHWAILRDLDPGPSGKCMDVDSGSRLLTGTWYGVLEPGTVRLTGCAGGVLSEREETVALNLKQAGFDRAGTTKPPHEAC